MPPGAPTPKRDRRPLWFALAAICLVVIVGGGLFVFRSPERIDAGPPAATPAGFRVVTTDDYRLAVPSGWVEQEITSEDRARVGDRLHDVSPGVADRFDEANDLIDGTMIQASDPVTHDNVNVVPFGQAQGDPTDPETMAAIRKAVDGRVGTGIRDMTTFAADVHGYPAVNLTYSVVVGSVTVHQVATVLQTGDRVFQVTVSSTSPSRVGDLSRRIVPTFDPV
jgi:hypothetical protein